MTNISTEIESDRHISRPMSQEPAESLEYEDPSLLLYLY